MGPPAGRGGPAGPPAGPPGRGGAPAPPGRGSAPAGPAGRGGAPAARGAPGAGRGRGRGGAGAAKGPQPTKPVIKVNTKMKGFFWKRVILPPDAPDTVIWKKIKEEPIDQAEIESLYEDAKAKAQATSGGDAKGVVKVTGPRKRTFFSAEEN